jgi:YbgC/YbaW family acyl-CoA thioester hydrolase
MIHEYRRRIFGYECDVYGHMNNANYLHLYEEARSVFLEDINLPIRRLQEMGIAIFITRAELEFIRSVPLEAEVLLKSWVLSGNRLRGLWQQEIYVADELCSRITIEGVYARNGRPQRLPQEIMSRIRQYFRPELDFRNNDNHPD